MWPCGGTAGIFLCAAWVDARAASGDETSDFPIVPAETRSAPEACRGPPGTLRYALRPQARQPLHRAPYQGFALCAVSGDALDRVRGPPYHDFPPCPLGVLDGAYRCYLNENSSSSFNPVICYFSKSARRYALFTMVGIAGDDDLDAPDLNCGPRWSEPPRPTSANATIPDRDRVGGDGKTLAGTTLDSGASAALPTSLSARWRASAPRSKPPNGLARLSPRRTHSPRPTLGSLRWHSRFACHPLRPKGLRGTRAWRRQKRASERCLPRGTVGLEIGCCGAPQGQW